VLVLGDLICDHYVWGDVDRVSPEAPVPILRFEREANRPGGAANVAMNLAALGSRVSLCGVVGRDPAGRWLLQRMRAGGVDTRGVVQSPTRPTTVKTRVIARNQHLLRIDREVPQALPNQDEQPLVAAIIRIRRTASAVICSDYGKGVLSTGVLRSVLRAPSRGARPVVLVDPKGRDFMRYQGADILTPNERELLDATSAAGSDGEEELVRRAEGLMRQLGLKALLVTRGAEGIDLYEPSGRGRQVQRAHIPVLQRHEVFDVTGAGDTVVAVMGMAVAAGLPLMDAARLANAAAGIVVGIVGTAVADSETLGQVVDGGASQARSKVLSRSALLARVAEARARGARVVLTNGCFDLLHIGHLHLLETARALGDLLIVAINDDQSVRRLKGLGRPMIPESQRAAMLAAMRFVDYVTLFSEPTPLRLIQALRPDVLVKGGDYALDEIVGRDVVEGGGGRVVVVPLLAGLSTSALLETIRRSAP
jgi:D-beta-D-heptose 7-phosphate kinase/D-beta-D-heptose 1-phosphate adenosyltransferase